MRRGKCPNIGQLQDGTGMGRYDATGALLLLLLLKVVAFEKKKDAAARLLLLDKAIRRMRL